MTKQIRALLTAVRVSGGKDECQIRLIGIERDYWMGTEIGRLGGYSFRALRGTPLTKPMHYLRDNLEL